MEGERGDGCEGIAVKVAITTSFYDLLCCDAKSGKRFVVEGAAEGGDDLVE